MIEASSRAAWRELESKLRPFVARRVRSETDADDVLQDVFLRMQRGLEDLRDEERFGAWVYQIARRAIADHHRVGARHPVLDREPSEEAEASSDDVDDGAIAREFATYVAPFIAALSPLYREALTLTELEGMTQKAAAAMMGISQSGMKSRVQRGRQQLRIALEDCCHIALDSRGRVIGYEPRPDGKLPGRCCPPEATGFKPD